jgi:hypothetical protein
MAEEKDFDKDHDEKNDCCQGKKWHHRHHHHGHRGSGGAIYCFAVIGAAVYFVQQVSGFWPIVLAILKAIVWPAFLIYKVFTLLHM